MISRPTDMYTAEGLADHKADGPLIGFLVVDHGRYRSGRGVSIAGYPRHSTGDGEIG